MALTPFGLDQRSLTMMRWAQALAGLAAGAQAGGMANGGPSGAGMGQQPSVGAPRAQLDARGTQALGAWSGSDSFARGTGGLQTSGAFSSSAAGAAQATQGDAPTRAGESYRARGTGYYPANNAMEGGFKDRKGAPLHTLQDYLAGKAPYVSVAMDSKAFPYGTKMRIPELEKKYGRPIEFRVVDTGGAFRGKGTSRIDICTKNNAAAHDPVINGPLTLIPQR